MNVNMHRNSLQEVFCSENEGFSASLLFPAYFVPEMRQQIKKKCIFEEAILTH